HFTRFAVLLLGKDQVCPFAGACGGPLDGTWKYTASCLGAEEDPNAVPCGTAGPVKSRQEYLLGGTVTIAAGRFTAAQQITASLTLFYQPACLAVLRDSVPSTDCATLQA